MALTQVNTKGITDATVANADLANEAVNEAKIQISNAGTNGQYLQKQSGNTGGLTWADVSAGVTSDGQNNTIAGTNAGDSFTGTDATNNTLFGYNAGTAITTGDYNTAVGSLALEAATSGWAASTAIG